MRLNAFLAACGLASRRKVEAFVREGRVRVNGKIVLAPFFQVDPDADDVRCDDRPVSMGERTYVVMNKPPGVVCAVTDKYDPVVVDLLPEELRGARLWPVGRLDRESEGLLILTDDGAFAQEILHPSKGVLKGYEALLDAPLDEEGLARWRAGSQIEGRHVAPVELSVLDREPQGRWISVVIGEGLKREVRVMAKRAGRTVERLIRRSIGGLVLVDLPSGASVRSSFRDLYDKISRGGPI